MIHFFLSILASVISVVNPFGAVPLFLSMTPDYTDEDRKRTSLHTSLYFIAILLVFFVGGTVILSFFGISLYAMRIAGGIIIFTSGLGLLRGRFAQSRAIDKQVKSEALEKEDISFSPMAMPMLSGPGSISLLIGLWAEYPSSVHRLLVALAVIVAGLIVFLILRYSHYLFKLLGVAGLRALSRIMGFIVMTIGIQYVISGLTVWLGEVFSV
ncbi:MAG TPA: NAAT family transporter [Phaeodactylibacter sp.]|nr:NAAT family transporter [Phaeodactylibacter sp.]